MQQNKWNGAKHLVLVSESYQQTEHNALTNLFGVTDTAVRHNEKLSQSRIWFPFLLPTAAEQAALIPWKMGQSRSLCRCTYLCCCREGRRHWQVEVRDCLKLVQTWFGFPSALARKVLFARDSEIKEWTKGQWLKVWTSTQQVICLVWHKKPNQILVHNISVIPELQI